MRDKRPVDELSIEELERILAIRKREDREKRLRRMRESGRVIEPAPSPAANNAGGSRISDKAGHSGVTPAAASAPNVGAAAQFARPPREAARPSEPSGLDMPTSLADLDALLQTQSDADAARINNMGAGLDVVEADTSRINPAEWEPYPSSAPSPRFEDEHTVADSPIARENTQKTRRFTNRLLLLVEVAAVVGLFVLGVNMLTAIGDLQNQTAEVQREANAQRIASIPTAEPTSIIQVKLEDFLLPGGHVVENNQVRFNYAELEQYVPANLQTALRNQVAQSIEIRRPEITAEDAEILYIDKLRIDQTIVPGADEEALKQGVGRVLNGARPGDATGNVVLAAHNDVYSELFSELDALEIGDRFVVQTRTKTYEYEVISTKIVAPDEVSVMDDQGYPSVTLITCITRRTVNDSRLVVLARRLDAQGF